MLTTLCSAAALPCATTRSLLEEQHIHSLKPGDTLDFKGPIEGLPIIQNEFDTIGLIAGGSGVTPMLQVIPQIGVIVMIHDNIVIWMAMTNRAGCSAHRWPSASSPTQTTTPRCSR